MGKSMRPPEEIKRMVVAEWLQRGDADLNFISERVKHARLEIKGMGFVSRNQHAKDKVT
jgi:hypothetical protein